MRRSVLGDVFAADFAGFAGRKSPFGRKILGAYPVVRYPVDRLGSTPYHCVQLIALSRSRRRDNK
jgi:hypothetical protein